MLDQTDMAGLHNMNAAGLYHHYERMNSPRAHLFIKVAHVEIVRKNKQNKTNKINTKK